MSGIPRLEFVLGRRQSYSVGLLAAVCVLAVACSGDSGSPLSPSPVGDPVPSTTATIRGQVRPLDGSSLATTSLTVSVVDSNLSAAVDGTGHFALEGIEPGRVELHFTGPEVDARLYIGWMESGDVLDIEVSISGSNAVLEDSPPSSEDAHAEGVITGLGGACPNVTFRVEGTLVRTSAATAFDDGGCAALTNGDRVRVDGVQQPDGSVQASQVEVDEPSDLPSDDDDTDTGDINDGEVHPEGMLTSLGGACPNLTFRVAGTLVRTSAATVFDDGGCAALTNGDRVRVDGVQQPDGSVQASQVEVDRPSDTPSDDDGEVHPEGMLTSLGGACPNVTFRVAGTLVRTSAATVFDDGGCAALSNGDYVRVDGFRQLDGSVQATEVEVDEDDVAEPDDDPEPVALELEIDPDEWRLDWSEGSQSGGGDENLRIRIRGSGATQIVAETVDMSGPGGTVQAVNTDLDDDFEAEFAKTDAIGLIGGAQDGATVSITVRGQLTDGSSFSLTQQVSIRE